MKPEDRLAGLKLSLPEAPEPLGAYVPAVRAGNLLFLSGMLPLSEGKLLYRGKAGNEVTPEEAAECAGRAALNALAVLKRELGELSRIRRCVKLTGYIASAPDFTGQPKVLNAASELIYNVFGDIGKHARAAVGVNVLPLDSPVEIDFIFEVSE